MSDFIPPSLRATGQPDDDPSGTNSNEKSTTKTQQANSAPSKAVREALKSSHNPEWNESNEIAKELSSKRYKVLHQQALNTTSLAGEICRLVGVSGALIGAGLSIGSLTLSGASGFFGINALITFPLAIAGAPIAALGTMASQSKKQTALMALIANNAHSTRLED